MSDEFCLDNLEPEEHRTPCPCKRVRCERHGDCEACWNHHHKPGKKMPVYCERKLKKSDKAK